MDKIKVLHIVSSMNMGGVQTFIMSVYRNLNKDKFFFDFASMNKKNIFTDEVHSLGGDIFFVESHKHPIKHFLKLRKVLKDGHYDVVHIHSNNAICVVEAIIVRLCSYSKTFVHSHNTSGGNPYIHKVLRHLLPFFADKMLGCSKSAISYMFPKCVVKKSSCSVINNGINTSKFEFNQHIREKYRRELNVKDNLVIGTIGRFWEQKNPDGIICILEETLKLNYNVKLMWVGDGPLRSVIEAMIKERQLSDHVILTGNRQDANCLLQAMDVFIFPSFYEGLGISAIEAQVSGLPTLCSKSIPQEVCVTELCEFLDIINYEQWANRIISLSLVASSRRSYLEEVKNAHFDIDYTCDTLQQMYLDAKHL